jgi:hypothetical protein
MERVLKVRLLLSWKNQKGSVYEEVSKEEVRDKLSEMFMIARHSNEDITAIRKWK